MSDRCLVDETYPTGEVQVAFEPDPRASVVSPAEAFCIMHQGEWVGEAVLIRRGAEQTPLPDVYLTKLYIDTPHRGRGLGTAALLHAAHIAHESGAGLCTDPIGEYEDVRQLWQKLADRGIARVIELSEPVRNHGHGTSEVLNHDRLRIPGPSEAVTSTD